MKKDLTLVTQHLVMYEHLNFHKNIFGGTLLSWIDQDTYIYVSNEYKIKNMVTLSMNNVYFRKPANLGDIVQIYASIKECKGSKITAVAQAIAYNSETNTETLIIECEVTYVAISESGRPIRIKKSTL